MIHVSEDRFFPCPFCGEENCVTLNYSDGLEQQFVIDCEVCCKPIRINLELTLEGVAIFTADPES